MACIRYNIQRVAVVCSQGFMYIASPNLPVGASWGPGGFGCAVLGFAWYFLLAPTRKPPTILACATDPRAAFERTCVTIIAYPAHTKWSCTVHCFTIVVLYTSGSTQARHVTAQNNAQCCYQACQVANDLGGVVATVRQWKDRLARSRQSVASAPPRDVSHPHFARAHNGRFSGNASEYGF